MQIIIKQQHWLLLRKSSNHQKLPCKASSTLFFSQNYIWQAANVTRKGKYPIIQTAYILIADVHHLASCHRYLTSMHRLLLGTEEL